MSNTETLERLANTIPNLQGCKCIYSQGNGYYLTGIHPVIWFSSFRKGVAWLKGYRDAGKGNFALLRVGVSK